MAKNEEKSKAEIYREERKARIAKANKKNAKKLAAGKTAGSIVKRIIAIVLAVAIVGGAAYYVADNTGLKNKMITAVEVGEEKVSAATYYYYYYLCYQQVLSTQENYEQYGWSYYDSSLSPDEQDSPYKDDDGNAISWADELKIQATTRAQTTIANYNEAVKAGMELSEDELNEIDQTLTQFETNASNSGYSVNAFLKATFGFGLKDLKNQLKMEELASKFQTSKQEELTKAVTEEELKKELKENPNEYGLAGIRYYAFKFDSLTQEDGEADDAFEARKAEANKDIIATAKEVFEKISDEESFKDEINVYEDSKKNEKAEDADTAEEVKEDKAEDKKEEEEKDATTLLKNAAYSSLSSAIEEDGAKWAFDSSRKKGELKFFEGKNAAYIVYITSPMSLKAHSVSVRYCLIPYNSDFQKANSDDERTEAKDTATKLYDEWKKNNPTEDTFAQLCVENSQDTSTSDNGGLIDVRLNKMVSSFEDWCFDSSRKAGDCEVIEAEEYGYFLVYFVSNNKDDLDWKETAKETISNKAYEDYYDALLADDAEYATVDHDKAEEMISSDFCKKMKRNNAMNKK